MSTVKLAELRGIGAGFSDTFTDEFVERDRVQIVPAHHGGLYFPETPEKWHILSNIFKYTGELDGHAAIWAAVTTPHDARHTYETEEERILAFNAALTAGGYTAPDGSPLP
jgi:hypothetical protein